MRHIDIAHNEITDKKHYIKTDICENHIKHSRDSGGIDDDKYARRDKKR